MTHRRANDMLTVFVVIVAVFILVTPLLPNLDYWWNGQRSPQVPSYAQAAAKGEEPPVANIPKDNRIVIPKIRADAPIYEGANEAVLEQGPWRRPLTSTPELGGNTVVAGHRFSYNPSISQPFYHLDKLSVGDTVIVAWEGKVYSYAVSEKRVVPPTQISVESPTDESTLTIYTCTPLWNPKDRLVIKATLIKDAS